MLHKLKLLNTIEVPLERVEILHTIAVPLERVEILNTIAVPLERVKLLNKLKQNVITYINQLLVPILLLAILAAR
jgi:hypothetical protein